MEPRTKTDGTEQDCSRQIQKACEQEPYARKLGMRCLEVSPGCSKVEMVVDEGMKNLFGCAHGGAVFSLLDEAFQVACNTHGITAYALNVAITYVRASFPGDRLIAEAREVARTRRTGTYAIEVHNADGELIAQAQAVAYRTGKTPPFIEPAEG